MTEYMNTLSAEDTYISFSGEQLSVREEAEYLGSVFASAELGNMVKLFCECEGQIVGIADVRRELSRKERSKHVGIFGLTVAKEFRNDGLGETLAREAILHAQKEMPNLRLIWLHCFSINTAALHLYSKLGFSEVAKISGELLYKGEYIDGIQMVLPVTSSH
jgi:ribosomal protein S18 acetylase RimI-like enzyme